MFMAFVFDYTPCACVCVCLYCGRIFWIDIFKTFMLTSGSTLADKETSKK